MNKIIDREKVIRGLECCGYIDRPNCADCPEDGPGFGYACRNDLMKKALALLKAQEPVKPLRKPELFDSLYFCGKCSAKVGFQIRKDDSWRFKHNYCPECGKKVKWDG